MRALSPSAKLAKTQPLSRSKKTPSGADALASFQVRCASALRLALPRELKARGAALSDVDMDALAESLARKLAKLADVAVGKERAQGKSLPSGEWISTQEAANRCGYSRPFVAALLDSGTYTGKVHRTGGGHRRVLASEFEALVAQACANAPKALAQARKAVDLKPLDGGPATPRTERKQSNVRATALAHKLGLSA